MDSISGKLSVASSYITVAKQRYEYITQNYYMDIGSYWPYGCSFDAVIDFLNIAVSSPSENNPGSMVVSLAEAQSFLNSVATTYIGENAQGAWYDDWGWWGTATAKIYDPNYSILLPARSPVWTNFETICKQCFSFMKTGTTQMGHWPRYTHGLGAPNAYKIVTDAVKNNTPPTADWKYLLENAAPKFEHGCWQGDMSPDNMTPVNLPSGKGATLLGPFQDTVINTLYYEITQRVLPGGLSTSSDIENITNFLFNWMHSPILTAEQKLLNKFSDTAGLLRERVSIYANNDTVYGYRPELAWTGDQGLMLCGLVQRYKTIPASDTLALIKSIINGVFYYAVGPLASYEKIILPWSNQDAPNKLGASPGYDPNDYSAGTGVFMRGLLEACRIPDVLKMVQKDPYILAVLKDMAEICETPNAYLGAIFNENGGSLNPSHQIFNPFTELAVLTAAHMLLVE